MFYILVDDILKAKFFNAFSSVTNVIFLTNKLSCYLYLKKYSKRKVIFLTKNKDSNVKIEVTERILMNTISVLNGRQSIINARLNYEQMYNALVSQLTEKITDNDTIVLFNGNHASAIATADFFKQRNAKTLYAEISNLPGKMIFDPKGVNAQSILFDKPEILDSYPTIPELMHTQWVEKYVDYKNRPIPQSKINLLNYAIVAFDDLVSRFCFFSIKEDSLSFKSKVKMFSDKFKSKKILAEAISADLKVEYVFFPTQVTSDTQLKINSDINNSSGIKKIIDMESGRKIFVKIHPAESDISTIIFFKNLAAEGKIILVNNNTVELIRHARKVYTINSTVGLESLILGTELVVLGRAIYSNFNASRLKNYIHDYLINLDYFGENIINDSHVDKFKKLTEL